MTRKMMVLLALGVALGLTACGAESDPIFGNDPVDGSFALTNTTSYAQEGLLRGQGLKVFTEFPSRFLEPNTLYTVGVYNDSSRERLLQSDFPVHLRTNDDVSITPYAVMFDVGQYDDIAEGDRIRVTLTTPRGDLYSQIIDLSALRLPGWTVTEVEAPEVVVCDAAGNPSNAFAIGGQLPGETIGPVHVRGTGFVPSTTVDVYIVAAGDDWIDQPIPTNAADGLIHGPVSVEIGPNGTLPVTALGFGLTDSLDYQRLRALVGPYDLLVDTDRNGMMDHGFSVKDGGDGVDEQVGFTVQYSQQWLRARAERHILVNVAYNSSARGDGAWQNDYSTREHVFSYMNPPVMHQYHFAVTKWIVRHQDFARFWNNPEMETGPGGCIPFEVHAMNHMGIPTQRGCTNTGPTDFGPMAIGAFDVVFDRNGDGCYQPGEDILDVIGGANTTGDLVTFEEFNALDPADQVGFRIVE